MWPRAGATAVTLSSAVVVERSGAVDEHAVNTVRMITHRKQPTTIEVRTIWHVFLPTVMEEIKNLRVLM